jgi:hypothetical protein
MSGNAKVRRIISVGYANRGDKVGFIVWCPGKNISRDVGDLYCPPEMWIRGKVLGFRGNFEPYDFGQNPPEIKLSEKRGGVD